MGQIKREEDRGTVMMCGIIMVEAWVRGRRNLHLLAEVAVVLIGESGGVV